MRTTTTRTRALRAGLALPAFAIGALVLAGCGSGAGSASSSGSSGSSGSAGTTVTIDDAGGMSVLATSTGRTLYLSDQEHGRVKCSSTACQAIWSPLTVANGDQPSAPGTLAADLSTIKRPDGSTQVAFDGSPLYTFSLDHGSGQANGNGQADSFDGTDFTWHAATPTGGTTTSGSQPRMSGGNGYGY